MLMLMAYGPNDVEMPCMFFSSLGQAEALTDRWMKPPLFREVLWQDRKIWRMTDPEKAEKQGFYKAVFADYYGGCGEATAFALLELPVNRPFLNWNLD